MCDALTLDAYPNECGDGTAFLTSISYHVKLHTELLFLSDDLDEPVCPEVCLINAFLMSWPVILLPCCAGPIPS